MLKWENKFQKIKVEGQKFKYEISMGSSSTDIIMENAGYAVAINAKKPE